MCGGFQAMVPAVSSQPIRALCMARDSSRDSADVFSAHDHSRERELYRSCTPGRAVVLCLMINLVARSAHDARMAAAHCRYWADHRSPTSSSPRYQPWVPRWVHPGGLYTRCSSFFALTDLARHEPKQNQRIV